MWGTSVHGRASVAKCLVAALAMGGASAALLSGCSPGVDYPAFPAVHDTPAARTEAPMNAEQVQQATDDLITERTHLNSEAQNAAQSDALPPAPAANNAAAAAKKKKPAPGAKAATTGSTQTAGAIAKP